MTRRRDEEEIDIRPEFLTQLPTMAAIIMAGASKVSPAEAVEDAIDILEAIEVELGE